jgi:hypothetical protein
MTTVARERSANRGATIVAVVVSALSLAAVWWSTRASLGRLGEPREGRVCPMVYPAPPSCYPEWHVQVSVILTTIVVAAGVGAFVVVRRTRWRVAPIVALAFVGLVAWLVATQPNRFLPIW